MRWEPTLLRDGLYPAGCPNCDALSGMGSREIEHEVGFVVVRES